MAYLTLAKKYASYVIPGCTAPERDMCVGSTRLNIKNLSLCQVAESTISAIVPSIVEVRRSMAISRARTCIGLCLSLALSISLFGQENRQQANTESCRAFVGRFYTWYLAKAVGPNGLSKPDLAWKSRPYLFSPDLVRQLREDFEAQEKAGSDLVSLDADPFAGPDGTAERYIVERIGIKDGICWAEVHGVWEGRERETPYVTPELKLKAGRWVFVNFYFPSPSAPKGWNLLGALKAGRELRNKYGPRKHEKP
jgi:hypothetical protein